jgi:hypothetical protein
MNLNDPSLISAYLDDELDRATRETVERAIRSDPRLRSELEDVADIRELVSRLTLVTPPHPLTQRVEARLAAEQANQRAWQVRLRKFAVYAGHSSAAAALLLAGLIGWKLGQSDPRVSSMPSQGANASTDHSLTARSGSFHGTIIGSESVEEERVSGESHASRSTQETKTLDERSLSKIPESTVPDILSSDLEHDRHSEGLEELLRGAEIHRVLVRVDRLDSDQIKSVRDAITATPRQKARHAEITIWQDVHIDTEHPGAAVVFVVALDEVEHDSLKQRLVQIFPGNFREDPEPVDASLVAQLTQMPSIAVIDEIPRGTLLAMPPEISNRFEHALRSRNLFEEQIRIEPGAKRELSGSLPLGPFVPPNREAPQATKFRGSPLSRPARDHEGMPSAAAFPEEGPKSTVRNSTSKPPQTYLIWLTTA